MDNFDTFIMDCYKYYAQWTFLPASYVMLAEDK